MALASAGHRLARTPASRSELAPARRRVMSGNRWRRSAHPAPDHQIAQRQRRLEVCLVLHIPQHHGRNTEVPGFDQSLTGLEFWNIRFHQFEAIFRGACFRRF